MSEVPIMVMPWHRPDPCVPLKMQTAAVFKASHLDYLATLSLDSPPLSTNLTPIAGTVGPASNDMETMAELMNQGMSIAIIPMNEGTRQDHIDTIEIIRNANTSINNMRNMVYPFGIGIQTKGPGIRIGGLLKDKPITLALRQKITLTNDKSWRTKGTENYIYISLPEFCHVLGEGDILLIGSGVVILQVEHVEVQEATCLVVGNGVIQSYMPVSLPDVPLQLPPMTEEDIDDVKMAAQLGLDIVLASRTQSADLIKDFRRVLDEEEGGSGIKIWANIENTKGLDNIESIMEEADAIVLSRLSLLQDLVPEKLFLAQKIVMAKCNKAGVPVFLSSHLLPSMQVALTPSIAEVNDVISAILDGADGILLRNTTSHGKHPDLAVKTLVGICNEAEAAVWHHQTFSYLNSHTPPPIDPTHSIAISAVEASLKTTAAAILLATTSGRSAQLVARYRPRCPIIAITRYGQVARQLNSWRAIIPLHYVDPPLPDWTREVDVRFQFGIEYAKQKGMVKAGDVLILMNGWRQGAGFTNTIRLVYASDSFPWVYPHKMPTNIPADESISEMEGLAPDNVPLTRTKISCGEPYGTATSLKTAISSSMRFPSIGSRNRSMEAEFKSIASARYKEISSLPSLDRAQTKATTQLETDNVQTIVDIENELLQEEEQAGSLLSWSAVLSKRPGTPLSRSNPSANQDVDMQRTILSDRAATSRPAETMARNAPGTVLPDRAATTRPAETMARNAPGTVLPDRAATSRPAETMARNAPGTVLPDRAATTRPETLPFAANVAPDDPSSNNDNEQTLSMVRKTSVVERVE